MEPQKKAIGKITLLKKPVAREFMCKWAKKRLNGDDFPCQLLGCSGIFEKMPPLHEGHLVKCYQDDRTGKTADQIMRDTEDKVVPIKKLVS